MSKNNATADIPRGNESTCNRCNFTCAKPDQLLKFESIKERLRFSADQRLPFELGGEPGFYCVKSGFLKLSRLNEGHPTAVRVCGPRELVGLGKAASIESGDLSAQALGGDAEVCFIPLEKFRAFSTEEPTVLFSLLEIQSRLLEQSELRISGLSNHCLKNRVASILKFLNDKFGQPSPHGSHIAINIDRTTLAEMAGTVTESTARVLSELEAEQVIKRIGRALYIQDVEKLKKLAI